MQSEELRGIAEFDHIFISRKGNAYQKIDGELVLLDKRRDDRNKCMIAFKDKDKRKTRELCLLVIEAWGEKITDDSRKFFVIPKDGDKFNTALDNLEVIKR